MIGVILLLVATHSVTESTDRPSIPFSPVPSLPKPVSEARDTSHGLGGFYDLAGGVVNAIRPGELPHGTESYIELFNSHVYRYRGKTSCRCY